MNFVLKTRNLLVFKNADITLQHFSTSNKSYQQIAKPLLRKPRSKIQQIGPFGWLLLVRNIVNILFVLHITSLLFQNVGSTSVHVCFRNMADSKKKMEGKFDSRFANANEKRSRAFTRQV